MQQAYRQAGQTSVATASKAPFREREQPPAEVVIQSLLRLPQLVKIHQPNNKIFADNLSVFRKALARIWEERTVFGLRAHRGRLYLDSQKLAIPQGPVAVTAAKLMDFLERRGFYGFTFSRRENLTDADVVEFIRALNRSQGQENPAEWLKGELAGSWAAPITDPDFKIAFVFKEDAEGGKTHGRPVVWNAGTRTLAVKARKSYSRAMAVLTAVETKLKEGGAVSIAKSRRVVQDMVETLFEDERLLLNLSTIRDYDDYTCTHSVNVAILSMCLGRRLGLSRVAVATLGLSGLFHDLGKVDIPISLIRKTARFTPEEYEEVKNHSLFSVARIIQINAEHKFKTRLLQAPFEHHLGVDLGGYPNSELNPPLSLFGRIVAIADHYDALTSSRSYRPVPMNPEQALDIMTSSAGKSLDPLLLKVFINMVGIYPIGTLLILDTKEVAMVAETPPDAEDARPMAYLLDKKGQDIVRGELVDISERDEKGRFVRNILRCFHPSDFGLNASDILL
ncbi:MAG: HD domain-containing protein [Deltaproteobacteria bacterium]|jgi:HD-GYP domain-containing protein (c-di-GMP phosphodiesterase class II)|nr:HD domain-containing protein [Deltaproteobacteria bacterium]